MCGIFGAINAVEPRAVMARMGDALRHRGPDDCGQFVRGAVCLGHRRLSVIDPDNGHQPMSSSDNMQTIVYNGELFNYRLIREELTGYGHVFRTESDTEVIINAYRQWGRDCLRHFNGMFAFALWDAAIGKLWLVRDRLGEKPLYVMRTGRSLYFASEAKALWRVPGFSGRLDRRAIDQYLSFRYVPGERTFYEGIRKLPAAHSMVIDTDGAVAVSLWWNIPHERDKRPVSAGDCLDEFHELFASAVSMRMVSDVPLGILLSSGIDSSSIAVEMAERTPPVCITAGFNDGIADEREGAARLVERLGGHSHSFEIDTNDFSVLTDAVRAMDEPYGDAVIVATYLLARRARESVKVVLTGDGADECLGGYLHHDYFRYVPAGMPRALARCAALCTGALPLFVLDVFFRYPGSIGKQGKRRLRGLLNDYPDTYAAYKRFAQVFSREQREALYTDDFLSALEKEEDDLEAAARCHFNVASGDPLDAVIRWDLQTWFPEQTLMKLDRLSMAHGLEGRCPYADHRLVEFLMRMPAGMFHGLTGGKKIVRSIYEKRFPFLAKTKRPFYLSVRSGGRRAVGEMIERYVTPRAVERSGIFSYERLRRYLRDDDGWSLLREKQRMLVLILFMWLHERGEA